MTYDDRLGVLLHTWRHLSDPIFSDPFVVRFQTEGYCSVMSNGFLTGVASEIIDREILHHRSIERDFEWTYLSIDEPIDLFELLVGKGFEPGDRETICMASTSMDFAEVQHRVEKVSNEQGLADFKSVAERVFGKDFSYTTGVLAENLCAGRTNEVGFVAYDGSVPVSIGRLSTPKGSEVAGLYTGGTLPEYRSKGYYRSVVAARAAYARAKGLKFLSVDARDTSYPILEKLGFEAILESIPCFFHV